MKITAPARLFSEGIDADADATMIENRELLLFIDGVQKYPVMRL